MKPNYLHVAVQSALAAGISLGLPAGLLFWMLLLQQQVASPLVNWVINLLQANGLNKVILLAMCSFLWSYLLGKISGYQPWWKVALATLVGIIAGWFSPLASLDGWFGDGLPVHVLYAWFICGLVASMTVCVGAAYGILLCDLRAGVGMSLGAGCVAVLTVLVVIAVFDQFGVRVGGGNFAMSKITSVAVMMAALGSGAVFGVGMKRAMLRGDSVS